MAPGNQLIPASGAVPATGNLGESRTHGMWVDSSTGMTEWMAAQERLLADILNSLHSADGGRDQVNGTIDYAQAVRAWLARVRKEIPIVDRPEQQIIAAIPGGDLTNINAMSYYTGAVQ